jgi:lysozyme family protein
MDDFMKAFHIVIDVEKGFQDDPDDDGNWTGGKFNWGLLRGTKYGISAAAYPTEDIANLTIERAQFLYKRDYWDADRCGDIPWPMSLYLFDDAVNSGQRTAIRQLQAVLGATVDGVIGDQTISLAKTMTEEDKALFLASRIFDETKNPKWPEYGHGWAKRIVLLAQAGVT